MPSPHLKALRERLERLAEDGAYVAASRVLEWLPDQLASEDPTDSDACDLTSDEAGVALGRSDSTVRAYCRDGLLPGAYRQQGREWRIPRSALASFRATQARPDSPQAPVVPQTPHRRNRGAPDLSAWRKELDKCA